MRSASKRRSRVIAPAGLIVLACALFALLAAGTARAQDPPPQEPGVTLRVFELGGAPDEICTIKPGQTPNVDKLMPTINWAGDDDFGVRRQLRRPGDRQHQHAERRHVHVPARQRRRLRLLIDDALVIDHDGLHGATAKDGAVTLTAGYHALRIDYFEAGGGQQLTLEWRTPGDAAFTVVPNSVLSTDAGVVRVTAPGPQGVRGRRSTRPATACR